MLYIISAIILAAIYLNFGVTGVIFSSALMGVIIYLYFNLGRPSALGPLDYFSRRVQIKTDEERGVVEGVVFGKTFTVPIIDISFRYQEVTNSVTEPKIGSGMINGQLSTWHTGDYISYDKKTGNVRVYVLNGVDTIGSFEPFIQGCRTT